MRTETISKTTYILALPSRTVKRWGYELDLDLVLGRVLRLSASQGGLDGVDTLVSEAGDYRRQ